MECKLVKAGLPKPVPKPQKKRFYSLPKPNQQPKNGITRVIEEPPSKPHDLRDVLNALRNSKTNKIVQKKPEEFEPKPDEVCDLKYIGDMSHLDLTNTEFSFVDREEEDTFSYDWINLREENDQKRAKELESNFLEGFGNLKLCNQTEQNEILLHEMAVERKCMETTVSVRRQIVDTYTSHIKKIHNEVAKQHEIWQSENDRLYQEEMKHQQEIRDQARIAAEKFEEEMRKRDEEHYQAFQANLKQLEHEQACIDALEIIPEPSPQPPIKSEEVPFDQQGPDPPEQIPIASEPIKLPETSESTHDIAPSETTITAFSPTRSPGLTPNPPIASTSDPVPTPALVPIAPSPCKESPVSEEKTRIFEPAAQANGDFEKVLAKLKTLKQKSVDFCCNSPSFASIMSGLSVLNKITTVSTDRSNVENVNTLMNILRGAPFKVGSKTVNPEFSDSARAFIIIEASKRIISGGCDLHSNCVSMYASVACRVWSTFPEVGEVMYAQLGFSCPYLVPRFPPSLDKNSLEYKRFLGYKIKDQNVESDSNYCRRMRSTGEFYGLLVAQAPKDHPHGMQQGWMWLSRVLNTPPLGGAMAAVLTGFLSRSADAYLRCYREQFKKVIRVFRRTYIAKLKECFNFNQDMEVMNLNAVIAKILDS